MNPVAIDRRIALAVGSLVLGGILATGWWLVTGRERDVRPMAQPPAAQQPSLSQQTGLTPALGAGADGAVGAPAPAIAVRADLRSRVRGVVLLPTGRPAPDVTVTLYRQLSAWPEWLRVAVDVATTGGDGTFEFASEPAPDLLVGFAHRNFAGGLEPAPLSLPALELRLQRGFEVQGIVTNDVGLPMANVRVAIESTLLEERRLRDVPTDNGGRYRFDNVAVGTMRVVARHDDWQPKVLPNVVVGDDTRLDLRFETRALSLDCRVVAAATQEPVAGATVLALPPGQPLGRHLPASATTNADGSFRLAGLSPGNLRLEVRHEDFATVARTIVVGPSPAHPTLDLPARSQVRGRLHSVDLAAVRGSLLLLRSSADEIVSTQVQDDGAFVFPSVTPGWATLSVPDGRFAFAGTASVQPLEVEEQSGAAFKLDVGPPAVITGRVADAEGRPIAGARLTANQVEDRLRQAGSALIDRDLRKFGDQLARSAVGGPELLLAVTAADGSFRIAGLRPGDAELRVARAGFGSRRLTVDVPPCGETRSLQVEMPRGCRIAGRVTRGGQPLPGVQVGVVVAGLAVSAVTGDNGRYELVDLPPDEYRVRARYSTSAASGAARVAPDAPATVDLVFQPGRKVSGSVTGREGQPVEGAMVLVRGEPGNQVRTDSSGAYELEAPRRDVELQVVYGDRGVWRTEPVAATAEGADIQIDAPLNCTITVRVLGLPDKRQLPGVLLRVAPAGDAGAVRSRWIELQAGQLRDHWIPAGRSKLTFWAEGHAPVVRVVQFAAGEEHAFEELLLEPGCELRGVVLDDAGRPVKGAQVFLGEEIDLEVFQPQARPTGADGAFSVRGVAAAAATLVVSAPGYARHSVPLRLPQDVLAVSPLVVRVERGSKIEVRVASGSDGDVLVLRRNGRRLATAKVDEDGLAVFDHRAPGDYVVHRFGDEQQQVKVRVERSVPVVSAAL